MIVCDQTISSSAHKLQHLRLCENIMRELLDLSGFELQPIQPDFEEQHGNQDVHLKSYCAWHHLGAVARCALIKGPKAEIINLMIFPNNTELCPIFASEIILFGNKIYVAVIDHQWPDTNIQSPDKSLQLLQNLHKYYSQKLSPGGKLPEWALEHFTPWCIYSRPKSNDETEILVLSFRDYLTLWLRQCLPELTSTKGDPMPLLTYLQHHVDHTPGRVFLTKCFGSAWTENYLRKFMYAPITPPHLI